MNLMCDTASPLRLQAHPPTKLGGSDQRLIGVVGSPCADRTDPHTERGECIGPASGLRMARWCDLLPGRVGLGWHEQAKSRKVLADDSEVRGGRRRADGCPWRRQIQRGIVEDEDPVVRVWRSKLRRA